MTAAWQSRAVLRPAVAASVTAGRFLVVPPSAVYFHFPALAAEARGLVAQHHFWEILVLRPEMGREQREPIVSNLTMFPRQAVGLDEKQVLVGVPQRELHGGVADSIGQPLAGTISKRKAGQPGHERQRIRRGSSLSAGRAAQQHPAPELL